MAILAAAAAYPEAPAQREGERFGLVLGPNQSKTEYHEKTIREADLYITTCSLKLRRDANYAS